MKLAVILRGISYYDNVNVKVSNSPTVDYKDCVQSMEEKLLKPLRTKFDKIDFFLVTYNSSKLEEVIETFKPVDMLIYPESSILTSRHRITVKLMIDCIDLIESYSGYDNILMTRFDLFYYRPLDLKKVDFEKFNFGWKGEIGQCDDSFWLFKLEHIPRMKTYLHDENFHGNSCHDYNHKLGPDNCNYISKPLDPANGYHMPDFWLFARYLPEFRAGTYKLYDWPEKKKLAIILRGIMFYDGSEKVCYSNRPVDYKECYQSMMTNLIAPLKTVFDQIDFFIITYSNRKIPEILEDFKPIKDMIIYPRDSILTFRPVIVVKLMTDAMTLIEPYKDEYDNILITRSDLFYYNKPLDMDKVKLDSFNFGWKGIHSQCCDSFWLFTPKYIPIIQEYLTQKRNQNANACHEMHNSIPENERNYISRILDYDSKTQLGYGMPDFWFFGRYLPVWDKENHVLHTEDGDFLLYE